MAHICKKFTLNPGLILSCLLEGFHLADLFLLLCYVHRREYVSPDYTILGHCTDTDTVISSPVLFLTIHLIIVNPALNRYIPVLFYQLRKFILRLSVCLQKVIPCVIDYRHYVRVHKICGFQPVTRLLQSVGFQKVHNKQTAYRQRCRQKHYIPHSGKSNNQQGNCRHKYCQIKHSIGHILRPGIVFPPVVIYAANYYE